MWYPAITSLSHPIHIHYSNILAVIPITARTIAALPLCLVAPPVAEALGVLLAAVLLPLDEEPDELGLPSGELALAAAWKAVKLLAAVGLIAKTIPC